jgi:hypothetical protein
MQGWKARKIQLYKQQQSISMVNEEAEKVNILALSKSTCDNGGLRIDDRLALE